MRRWWSQRGRRLPTRLARFCEAVNPVLTGEQRGKLVELLREHLTHEAKE